MSNDANIGAKTVECLARELYINSPTKGPLTWSDIEAILTALVARERREVWDVMRHNCHWRRCVFTEMAMVPALQCLHMKNHMCDCDFAACPLLREEGKG